MFFLAFLGCVGMASQLMDLLEEQELVLLPDEPPTEAPTHIAVDVEMLENLEKSFQGMLEQVPRNRFTVPLQDDIFDSIMEAVVLKSMVESTPAPEDTSMRPSNIVERYMSLMEKHAELKDKANDASDPKLKRLKRNPTDEVAKDDGIQDSQC